MESLTLKIVIYSNIDTHTYLEAIAIRLEAIAIRNKENTYCGSQLWMIHGPVAMHESPGCSNALSDGQLEAKGGGRKLALQNGKVEGSEVGKITALFLEAGVKSPL